MHRVAALRAAVLCVALGGSGCGFRPLYAPSGETNAKLGQVFVSVITNRDGMLLRQALQEHLEGSEEQEKRYILTVSYSVQVSIEGVQQDNSVSRTRFIGTAHWVLKQPGIQGKTMTSGFAQSMDGTDAINSQFFYGDLQGDAIERRLGETLAGRITNDLAAYFRSHDIPA